jgi:hypothetical protein
MLRARRRTKRRRKKRKKANAVNDVMRGWRRRLMRSGGFAEGFDSWVFAEDSGYLEGH